MSQGNQARGLKATLSNPRVSDEAKQNAQQRLDNMEQVDRNPVSERVSQGKDEGNVLRGYKASMKNPNVSDEAREHSRQILEEHGAL